MCGPGQNSDMIFGSVSNWVGHTCTTDCRAWTLCTPRALEFSQLSQSAKLVFNLAELVKC